MQEGVRASLVRRIAASWTRARVAGGVSFIGALTILAVGVSSVGGAAATGRDGPPSAQAADDASILGLAPKLTPDEAVALANIERLAKLASQPTATASPIPAPHTATAVAPTATAVRPAATAVPPTVRPVVQPTAPPPPAAPAPTSTPQPPPPPVPTQAPVGPPPQSTCDLDTSGMDAQSQALFDATNRRRASAGLPALRANGQLVGIARIRSKDMADNNYFSHTSPVTGDTAFTLMDKCGVPYGWAGENLAKNNYPLNETVGVADTALWNSPPHKENILNPNYTDMGIALVTDGDGMNYFTIIFTGPA